jgi:hypothetical protein
LVVGGSLAPPENTVVERLPKSLCLWRDPSVEGEREKRSANREGEGKREWRRSREVLYTQELGGGRVSGASREHSCRAFAKKVSVSGEILP